MAVHIVGTIITFEEEELTTGTKAQTFVDALHRYGAMNKDSIDHVIHMAVWDGDDEKVILQVVVTDRKWVYDILALADAARRGDLTDEDIRAALVQFAFERKFSFPGLTAPVLGYILSEPVLGRLQALPE